MAIVVSALATGDTGVGGGTPLVLSSCTPSGSAVQFLYSHDQESGQTFTPNGSACGLTFTQVATLSNGIYRLKIWRAYAASPTTGQVSIAFGGGSNNFAAARLVEASGVKLTGTNGADAVVQVSTGQVGSGVTTGVSETLAAFADAVNNAALIFAAQRSGSAATPEGGYTALASYAAAYWNVEAHYKVGQDTSPSMTWSSVGTDYSGVAIELAAAGGGGGATINDHNFRSVGRGAGSGVGRGVASPRYLMQRRNRLFVSVGIDLRGVPLRQAA